MAFFISPTHILISYVYHIVIIKWNKFTMAQSYLSPLNMYLYQFRVCLDVYWNVKMMTTDVVEDSDRFSISCYSRLMHRPIENDFGFKIIISNSLNG